MSAGGHALQYTEVEGWARMEFRAMWKVIRRRWWLIAVPALVVLIYAVYGYVKSPPTGGYATSIRFTAGRACNDAGKTYEDCQYYPWLTSEYVVNALTDWVKTTSFSEAVSEELKGQGIQLAPGQIQAGIVSDNERSVMMVNLSGSSADQLKSVAAAVTKVLQTRSGEFFPQIGDRGVEVKALDDPVIMPTSPPLTARLNPLIRFALGLAGGVALAFLVDYLDPSIHEREEVEKMGLKVLAELPRK